MNIRQVACSTAAGFVGTLLCATVAFPVHAQPGDNPVVVQKRVPPNTRYVSFADLSLSTRDGRHMLYSRVDQAVSDVCPVDSDGDVRGCMQFAWLGAEPQIRKAIKAAKSGSPNLTMSIGITAANK